MISKCVIFITILAVCISQGDIFTYINENIETGIVISSGGNFNVYDITKDNQPEYSYEIYNKSGKLVKSEIVWRISPEIKYECWGEDTLISIRTAVGTGTSFTQYYDVNRDIFSEAFESVASSGYGKILYMDISNDTLKLVIRDIFCESLFYSEFDLDFSPTANPADALKKAEFINEKTIMLTYIAGSEYVEKELILQLN